MTETSKAYADALFSLAMENGQEEEILQALCLIEEVFTAQPDAPALLASPSIPKDERLAVLERAFEGQIPPVALNFMQVLCRNGHVSGWADVFSAYQELYDAARKLSTAYVTSAVKLTENEVTEIKNKLEKRLGRSLRMECSVDASLLGGLVIRVDGKVIDASIRHQLDEIKEVMNR